MPMVFPWRREERRIGWNWTGGKVAGKGISFVVIRKHPTITSTGIAVVVLTSNRMFKCLAPHFLQLFDSKDGKHTAGLLRAYCDRSFSLLETLDRVRSIAVKSLWISVGGSVPLIDYINQCVLWRHFNFFPEKIHQ